MNDDGAGAGVGLRDHDLSIYRSGCYRRRYALMVVAMASCRLAVGCAVWNLEKVWACTRRLGEAREARRKRSHPNTPEPTAI